jgi:Ca2+-binding EF-hand superfamily protein
MKATVTAHSVEEIQLQMAAMKLQLPASVGVVGFSALKEVFSVDVGTVKEQLHVFKELDKSNDGAISFEEFKDGFAKAFHDTSEKQTKLLHSFFLQLTGGKSHLDFRKFLIGLALVNEKEKDEGEKASDSAEASTSLDPEIYSNQNSIYAKMAFAAFAKEKDDVISLQEFKELWTWLHPLGMNNQEMAKVLGIPGPQERSASARKWFSRSSKSPKSVSPDDSPVRQESPPIANEDTTVTAGKVFALLSGGSKEEQVTWSQFEAYAKKNPIFIKDLRQSFFSRLAQEVPAKDKDRQKTGDQ